MSNFTEWENAGDSSKYPFAESSSAVSVSGWTVPEGLFADCQIRVPFGYNVPEISSLARYNDGLLGTVVSGDINLGTFVFSQSELSGGVVNITNSYEVVVGSIVAGRNGESEFKKIRNQIEYFTTGKLAFESSAVFYYPENVLNSITVNSSVVSGRVVLVETPGINIVKESSNSIRIDSIGDRTEKEQELDNCNRTPAGVILKKINNNLPDSYGMFRIQAGSHQSPKYATDLRQSIKIEPSGNTLTFSIAK